ncbi:hypothetical protein [Actinomadura violacea]|uniref:DUF4145 domain-containing protein n=1 Tax=Actinomadura violacea TaxID=2819934 RepID=A0ABS3RYU7_9ACTN|nr:hypothetical protein [Actinomadura violacea]MBO2461468.1 hypothetical protein [Actinomadura violacea]
MWDYDSYIGKAKLYFTRAAEHPRVDDDEMPLWLLLGLEFLLGAPLAKISPLLLADVEKAGGASIMAAAGYPSSAAPRTVPTSTVVSRLEIAIPDFTPDLKKEALGLVGLRNEELHTGNSPLSVDAEQWLPNFTRVLEVVCAHLGRDPADLIDQEIIDQGRKLVASQDQKLENEVRKRINEAKAFFERLKPDEISGRRTRGNETQRVLIDTFPEATAFQVVACPACGDPGLARLDAVRTTRERIEDDEIHQEVVYIAGGFTCTTCELALSGTPEIRAAGMQQQYIRRFHEEARDRYLDAYEPDYGND